jgi:hypothetical protein
MLDPRAHLFWIHGCPKKASQVWKQVAQHLLCHLQHPLASETHGRKGAQLRVMGKPKCEQLGKTMLEAVRTSQKGRGKKELGKCCLWSEGERGCWLGGWVHKSATGTAAKGAVLLCCALGRNQVCGDEETWMKRLRSNGVT